ncbi:hypothetical protein PoB_006167600 [Plakobranchus ocellatus]|uniref:RNase H type-1 domain-containing protein n=1 Tax=Plakobranchus ocellatus TaxID=259542 RepID=A0AAV4CTE9_9GAST|nr:hypothetical protein PoB_006167600 [Plakobranchus ocellatus]
MLRNIVKYALEDQVGQEWEKQHWQQTPQGRWTESGLVHWLLSHVGFIGNEVADAPTNEGRRQPQPQPKKTSTAADVRFCVVGLWNS